MRIEPQPTPNKIASRVSRGDPGLPLDISHIGWLRDSLDADLKREFD
jgi:hypothetical protein